MLRLRNHSEHNNSNIADRSRTHKVLSAAQSVCPAAYAYTKCSNKRTHSQLHPSWTPHDMHSAVEVLPRAPVGVYATYPGGVDSCTDTELAALRAELPALSPSVLPNCDCGRLHTVDLCLAEEGALHGDRVRGVMWLSVDDAGSVHERQLAGKWKIELIYDDSKANGWVRTGMLAASVVAEPLLTMA